MIVEGRVVVVTAAAVLRTVFGQCAFEYVGQSSHVDVVRRQ